MSSSIPRGILESLGKFCNEINGSLAAGLAGQGDAGLKESAKLPLAPPHLVYRCNDEAQSTSPWTVVESQKQGSGVLMAMAHAALIAKREGITGRRFETLSKEDYCKGFKVSAAFTAIHAGLVGYFEPNPRDLVSIDGGRVTLKGVIATRVPEGYLSETDTSDPQYPLVVRRDEGWESYYGFDDHAQDSRDMDQSEMDEAMRIAIESQTGDGWLKTYCTSENAGRALTLIIASKFNWFTTNHHVGQGHATTFINKMAMNSCKMMQGTETSITETAKDTIWEVGHWVSTHLCMNLMGMRTGVRVAAHPSGSPIDTARLAEDMKLRCDAAPAGMAKAALLYSAIKLYHRNMLWLVAPGFEDAMNCAVEYQKFLDDVQEAKRNKAVDPRMQNHEGRMFLTHRGDKTRIMQIAVPLGLIGSFLFHKASSSTMTASPLISVKNRNNRPEPRYQTHHGYSAEFDELCKVTKDKVLEVTKEVKELIGASDTALTISKADYVHMMKLFNVDRAESEGKFDHAFKSLGGVVTRAARGQKRSRGESPIGGRSSKRRASDPDDPLASDEDSDTSDTGEEDRTMADPQAGPSTPR